MYNKYFISNSLQPEHKHIITGYTPIHNQCTTHGSFSNIEKPLLYPSIPNCVFKTSKNDLFEEANKVHTSTYKEDAHIQVHTYRYIHT